MGNRQTNEQCVGKKIPQLPTETSIYLQGSGSDLYQRISSQAKFSIHRLRITKAEDGKPIPNDKKVSIDSFGLRDGDSIQVKDLGEYLKAYGRSSKDQEADTNILQAPR